MNDASPTARAPQGHRRRLSQLETDAIGRLFEGSAFDASGVIPPTLLTSLQEAAEDECDVTVGADSSHQSEHACRAPTVHWQAVEAESSCRSDNSSQLSTFSMHLARCDRLCHVCARPCGPRRA